MLLIVCVDSNILCGALFKCLKRRLNSMTLGRCMYK